MKKNKSIVLLMIYVVLGMFFLSCEIQNLLENKLLSITIVEKPEKITYLVGEKLDLSGLKVNGNYSDGSVISLGDYSTEPENQSVLETVGKIIVKVVKDELQCDFEIEVKEPVKQEEKEQEEPEVQEDLPQEEIQKCSLEFCVQPDNQQGKLYENLILNCSVNVKGTGTLSFDWYRRNSNELCFGKVFEDEKQFLDPEKTISSSLNITSSPFLNSEYYCEVSLKNEKEEIAIKSDTVTVKKELPYTGLPTVVIETEDGEDISSRTEYKGTSIEIKSNNSSFETFTRDKIGEASIKGRGNSSWGQQKNSYTLKLKNKQSFFGLPKSKKWVLAANHFDKTLLRNDFASYLGNNVFTKMGWNPHFQSVDLVKNGEYVGTYLMGEQIKIDSKRVNIQSVADTFNGKKGMVDVNNDGVVDIQDGGFIIEIDGRLDANWYYITTHSRPCCLKDPDTDDFVENSITLPQEVADYISNRIQTAEDALYSDSFKDPFNGYSKYFDVDSFIDWYLINEFTMHDDAACYFTSCYFYYDSKDQKIHMGPNWDFDVAMGNYSGLNLEPESYWGKQFYWTERLFEDPAFVVAVKNRWNEIKIPLKNAVEVGFIQKYYEISLSAELNYKRWDVNSWVGFYAPIESSYNGYIRYLKEWLEKRYAWLDTQIQSW